MARRRTHAHRIPGFDELKARNAPRYEKRRRRRRRSILDGGHHHEQVDHRRQAGEGLAPVENVELAVAASLGREEPPISSGFRFAESAAQDLLAAPDRIEEKRLL